MRGERDFHLALGAALVPVLGAALTWVLALRNARPSGHAPVGPWRRRLLGLALVDTVVAVAMALLLVRAPALPAAPPVEPPRIGVHVDTSHSGGARILGVWPGSPAEQAGLRSGDVVVAIDGEPVTSWERLTAELAAGDDGAPRSLRVVRDEGGMEVVVVPRASLRDPPRSSFEPISGECGGTLEQAGGALWPLAGATLLVVVAALAGRRRSAERAGAAWMLVLVPLAVGPLVGALVGLALCRHAGGWSVGALLTGTAAQGAAMLALGLLLLRLLGGSLAVVVEPRLTPLRASGLAVYFVLAALARALPILAALLAFVPEAGPRLDTGLDAVFGGVDDAAGRALLLATAVVLAPLAEEVIFRGVMLPAIARSAGASRALVLTAVVFGLFHVPSHGAGAVAPALLGVVFGWARLRTGGLAAPIALHALNNLVVTLIAWRL
jgi:membrane protease YdiL (CAAX protease family)